MSKEITQFELVLPTPDVRGGWTSASNATADTLCEGRHQAQVGLPDLPREEGYAEHGTAIHEALATRDPSKLSEAALQTYERCLEIEEMAVKQFFTEEERQDLMTVAEERFWVELVRNPDKPDLGKLKHSGQVDRVYRSKTKALVLEYKTLPGEVASAASNEQLRDQVCLVSGNLMVTNIGAVVVQPLVTMKPELCAYNAEQIKAARAIMFDRVRASNRPGAKRAAGNVQCLYCKAKFQCKEYATFAAGQMPVMQSFIDAPVATWTAEQCGVFLERQKSAREWLDGALAQIRDRIERGELPGWKIGEGDRKFIVTDMTTLFNRSVQLGISEDEFMNLCTPNKEQLTKLVRKVTNTKGKALTQEVEKLLNGICADERKRGSIERVQQQPQLKG